MGSIRSDLRRKAEAMFSKSSNKALEHPADESLKNLLYEFQVHQIELELQNEELKHAQHELMMSRDNYANLYNSSPIGYLTLDEAGVIQKANPAAALLLGADINDLVHKKLGRLINPSDSDQDSYYFFINDILTQHTEQKLILRLLRTDDTPYPIDCAGYKYCGCMPENCPHNVNFIYLECRGIYNASEHDPAQINLSMTDITEAKIAHETIACLNEKLEEKVFQQSQSLLEAHHNLLEKADELKAYEQKLNEREKKLNAIFNAAVEGIITINLSGIIISVNNAVEKIFGYPQQELINCNISLLIPLSQYANNANLDTRLLCVAGNIKEANGLRKDGSIVPLDVSTAQFTVDGTSYLTKIVRDVTERKRQAQRDQEHVDELAHVTRLGLMGEMASGIAHEVNQPLTAITSYAKACLNLVENDAVNQAQLNNILQKTYQQALKAGQIIHRMRDFVKSKKIHRSTVDANQLIYDTLGLCTAYLKQNNLAPQLQLADGLPQLFIDHIQIEQVILNLIRNSVDALNHLPHPAERNLSIQTLLTGHNEIEVRIKDNGPGINPEEQKNILTPFYTTKPEGMGMGLSICRTIIESHGGVLRFNSQPGKGTTFYFTLPVGKENNGTE